MSLMKILCLSNTNVNVLLMAFQSLTEYLLYLLYFQEPELKIIFYSLNMLQTTNFCSFIFFRVHA